MSPAAGVPLHFTVEALGLGVAGVALAWSALSRRWVTASGAGLLALAQVVYAGQFFAPDDPGNAAAGVLRLGGLLLIAVGSWRDPDRVVLASGAALVGAGTVWRVATSDGPASLAGGVRALVAFGFVLLAVWAWRRAAASVRSRIVAAFIGVLGAAVIVMGGAAARVSVSNAIENTQTRLSAVARTEQQTLNQRVTDLLNRAALGSAVATQSGLSAETFSALERQAFPDADYLSFVRSNGAATTSLPGDVRLVSTEPVAAALRGRGATGLVGIGDAAMVLAAQPVFSPGTGRSPRDVAGALTVGLTLDASNFEALANRAGDGVDARLLVGGTSGGRIPSFGPTSFPAGAMTEESGVFSEGHIRIDGTEWLRAAFTTEFTEPPVAAIVLSIPVSRAADVATSFPRALVGGVLVAALLAVVLALWLAARITRPILSLADEAERVKTDFLSTVSHELRTPLTPIRGYADLLRRGRVPRRRAEVYIDEIDEAARRLERIVTLLVEVAGMEAGRYRPELEPVSAADLLSAAAARWRPQSARHKFVLRVPKSLPKISADERSIGTVLDELIDNAVKFSPKGGTIELRARRTSAGVEFAVADEGIGLDADALQQLTAAFVQAEPGETRRFGGIGLGLTFAAGVLAAHGSRLDVETSESGATFSFELPPVGMVSRMSGRGRRDGDVTT